MSPGNIEAQRSALQQILSKKDFEKFNSAKSAHRQKNYNDALKTYCKLLDKYEGNYELELWVGLAYKDKGQPLFALPYLINATEGGNSTNALLYSTIGGIYKEEKNYNSAKEYFALFLDKIDSTSIHYSRALRIHQQIEFIIESMKHPVPFTPRPMGHAINTLFSEYLPQFTADHKTVFFTRRVGMQEDIYFATDSKDNNAEAIPFQEINTSHNEGAHSISADGNVFIFTHCNEKTGVGGCDLYATHKTDGGWSKPKNMGSRLNTILWDSQPSLSGDGNILFFSSTRDGGYGGKDVWYSVLSNQGTWSVPINAGPVVNTSYDESSPFLHADLKTLYFRSNGHLGIGDFDLFVARQDSFKQWKDIKNLGYPINTEGAEGALTVSLDGTKAYFATDFDGESKRNNLDIYEFDLPEKIRPSPCTYIKIRTIDEHSKIPIRSILEIVDIETNEIITRKRASLDGEILVPIQLRKSMMINVSSIGHVFYSDNILLDTIAHGMAPYERTISLSPLIIDDKSKLESKTFILKNIFFESGTAELKEISISEIRKLKKILDDHNSFKINITGHTDNVGSENDNLILSKERAEAVKNVLVQMEIVTSRVETEGMGEGQPISENNSAEGRRQNRRTEFRLIVIE